MAASSCSCPAGPIHAQPLPPYPPPLPSRQSCGLSYPHVALVTQGGGQPKFLTEGQFVVTKLLAWDGGRLSFTCDLSLRGRRSDLLSGDRQGCSRSKVRSPSWTVNRMCCYRHLYTVPADGSCGSHCITCNLNVRIGGIKKGTSLTLLTSFP